LWSDDFPSADRQGWFGSGCRFHGVNRAESDWPPHPDVRTCPIKSENSALNRPEPLIYQGKIFSFFSPAPIGHVRYAP
jgi:hypothetical protein